MSARKIAAAVASFTKIHPKASDLTTLVRNGKIALRKGGVLRSAPRALKAASRDFFVPFYTRKLADEDNRLAAHSVTFDPADFRE